MTDPTRYARRSFVYRRLIDAGAEFVDRGDSAIADRFPGRGGLASRLALVDLSPLPRGGYKGPGALSWLRDQGVAVPPENNRALAPPDGGLIVRLADGEAMLLGDIDGATPAAEPLPAPKPDSGCYPVPRRDSHAWFVLCGDKAVDCLAKLCAVDLRAHRFADLSVAQTSVAHLSAIVIRQDRGGVPAFHLLADSAAAVYFWDALTDAMDEFLGAPAGIDALRALGAGAPSG